MEGVSCEGMEGVGWGYRAFNSYLYYTSIIVFFQPFVLNPPACMPCWTTWELTLIRNLVISSILGYSGKSVLPATLQK